MSRTRVAVAVAWCVVVVAAVILATRFGGGPATPSPAASASTSPGAPSPAPGGAPIDDASASVGLRPGDRLQIASVAGERRITDRDGRPILLRGVSVNALVDYGASHSAPVEVRAADFDQMAALGLNVMRLAVSWSRVMPEPGELDRAYLRRITTLVRRAASQRIYTVISMHSDRYAADLGTDTEFDGAPSWAVATDGLACGDPRPRYYTPCAAAAARHFYRGDSVSGRTGLQWYTDAVAAVAAAGRRGGPGYAGTDILNEPTDPDASPDAAATEAWIDQLHALQRGIVRRLRASGERAPIWIQPQGPRSTGPTTRAVLPTLSDDQLVYAPHAYVDVYDGGPTTETAARMRAQYRAFEAEARALRAAGVVGEFPGATGPGWEELRREHLKRQVRIGFGGIAWLWKQPDDGYGWGTLEPDGGLRTDTNAAQVLSAPRLVAGSEAVQVERDGATGEVLVRSKGSAQVADVWLGTRFGSDAEPSRRYRFTSGERGPITVDRAWSAQAALGSTRARGTMVRLRLPAGETSARLAPAD